MHWALPIQYLLTNRFEIMTHEFIQIVQKFRKEQQQGVKCVLATVVLLEGSSYRRPGVRMLITENNEMIGAVSGGCVEKEVLKQSASVFLTGIPKVMTYDGRYRLGCEGILYILLETFTPSHEMLLAFDDCLSNRAHYHIKSYFDKSLEPNPDFGSRIIFDKEQSYHFNRNKSEVTQTANLLFFEQFLEPSQQLIIIGAEHDAAQVSLCASFLGWDVLVVTHPADQQTTNNFPGARSLIHSLPEKFPLELVKKQTAVVLMNHNYAKDLGFLTVLLQADFFYLGILGPVKRREKLLSDIMDMDPQMDISLLEKVHAPAGINLGSETPQEIAVSICSEILAVQRKEEPCFLKNKSGKIHEETHCVNHNN